MLGSGTTDALVLNSQRYLVDTFRPTPRRSPGLRVPTVVSGIACEAVTAIEKVRKRVPISVPRSTTRAVSYRAAVCFVPERTPSSTSTIRLRSHPWAELATDSEGGRFIPRGGKHGRRAP
jgi:hypothetical protein